MEGSICYNHVKQPIRGNSNMYKYLSELLSDKKGGVVFSCFGIWHWLYIFAAVVVATLVIVWLKNKDQACKDKTAKRFINIAFGLYMADFFLMPFAYGEIDIEKLPFHICTVTCVLCFLSRRNRFLDKYRSNIALLAFISNLVYLIYPAGVMWYQVHPLSYRVIQTLIFHGVMTIYGLLVLIFDEQKLEWKKCYRDIYLLIAIVLWAILGNMLYNNEIGESARFYNWFFVIRDPFYILPATIAPYIMPFINVAVFFAVENFIYLIIFLVKKMGV